MSEWGAEMIKLTSASCWRSTNVWTLVHLSQTDVIISLMLLLESISGGASVLTPDMWIIHTRLVIGQSDERRVRGPLVNQVQQNLLVVDRQVVHVLWSWRSWEAESQTKEKTENNTFVLLRLGSWCLYVCIPTYWSRSRNRSPPCPWPVSWRSSMPKEGSVGTAIWPPGASRRPQVRHPHTHEPGTTHTVRNSQRETKLRLKWPH